MKKIKFDGFTLRLLTASLYKTRDIYADEERKIIDSVTLRVIEAYEKVGRRRKAKVSFESDELRLMKRSVMEYRNRILAEGGPSEDLNDLFLMLNR